MKKFIVFFSAILLLVTSFAQTASLTQTEKEAILYMREEEKLARDVYEFLYAKWAGNPFGNIRQSEQTHMNRMKILIATYKLTDPVEINKDKPGVFSNTLMQQYYNELTATGSQSLTDALKVGAKIEELDINDLNERISQTKRTDITRTYIYLKEASENHLRAFTRRMKMLGLNYEPVILTKTEFDKIISAKDNNRGNGGRWN